ncbi:MAG: GTP 3',8-cyclase MoaA [Phycisphaerales bacterium]|nr:MAG: GTP 3',8-cyclase MoaA [Phycisphaerales bacterium]
MRRTDIDYLRLSVTDRCNLHCIYCNPLDQQGLTDRAAMLSTDEICRVVRLCVESGVARVRLTGGEPLVRSDIVALVRKLAGIKGITDLSLTTNGILLASMAQALKDAGLQRVNVSLDATEGQCFRRMTGSGEFARVLDGIQKALAVGLAPVRINCVVLRTANLSQVANLAEMSLHRPVSVRFIEYCPPGAKVDRKDWYVPNEEVRRLVESHLGPLSPAPATQAGGPALYFRARGALGTIGFISGRSSTFCRRCSRLRLTCDGRLRPCLHCAKQYGLGTLLRSGASDNALLILIGRALHEKSRYTKLDTTLECFSMQHVGG